MSGTNNPNFVTKCFDWLRNSARVLSTKLFILLLCIGVLDLFFIAFSLLFSSPRPTAFLFHCNAWYWSTGAFVVIWLIALWLITEVFDLTDGYWRAARIIIGLLCLFFAGSLFVPLNSSSFISGRSLLIYAVIAAVVCAVRSVVLFNNYSHGRLEGGDMEEAKWFWGITGFIVASIALAGTLQLITFSIALTPGVTIHKSLWVYCRDEFQQTIRNGDGSMIVRLFGVLLFFMSLAFVFFVYKWITCCIAKLRSGA